jgi:3-deoxy-D-manno-octulosonic-acid transferase
MIPGRRYTLLLLFYLSASTSIGWFGRRKLRQRLRAGKEDAGRIGERMGVTDVARPDGRLVWFHAASVGETLSLLPLLERLRTRRPEWTCLITSGTLTSSQLLAERLPKGCIHQFVPVDILPWVRRFLGHWRPDLAVWIESELWPGMIWATRRRDIPMLLINARISEKTFRRWKPRHRTAAALLNRFSAILAQDTLAGRHLADLGVNPGRLSVAGTLKESAAPLPDDETAHQRVAAQINGRPSWVAASTHPGEEDVVLAVHREAVKSVPGLFLLLVPRHPERGDALAEMIRGAGFRLAQRSREEQILPDTDVYLADTLGELGIWYRISPVSFVGGSLEQIGGHNPFEPALLGSAIIHGPHVRNFAEAYHKLTEAGAAIEISNPQDFARVLIETLAPREAARMAAAAWEVCSQNAEVLDRVLAEIDDLISDPA